MSQNSDHTNNQITINSNQIKNNGQANDPNSFPFNQTEESDRMQQRQDLINMENNLSSAPNIATQSSQQIDGYQPSPQQSAQHQVENSHNYHSNNTHVNGQGDPNESDRRISGANVSGRHDIQQSDWEGQNGESNKLQKSSSDSGDDVDDNSANDTNRSNFQQQEQSKPLLKILKFDQTAPDGDLHSHLDNTIPRSTESQNREPMGSNMVNKDLSPLSPQKPRYNLGDQSNTAAQGNESEIRRLDSNVTNNTENNGQQWQGNSNNQGFTGLLLKSAEVVDQMTSQSTAGGLQGGGLASAALPRGAVKKTKDQLAEAIPANPLLPKQVALEPKQPPQCPLKDIQFVQLQKFKRFKEAMVCKMGDGYDQVGKKNMMRENREKRRKYDELRKEAAWRRGHDDDENEAKMDEFTHIIQNIVYARDPKIFDTKNGFVNQRAAFMHENMLDIKNLIRINEERNGASERFGSKLPPPKRVQKTRQQIIYEQELEAKARYKLREGEDGKIDRNDKTLLFESRFESGNLYLAQKVSDHEYNLLMQNDINTSGHTQWFFFQVKNTRKNMTCQFNIMNFTKPDSLFNYGMKISIYSEKMSEQEEKPGGWFRGGERISYYGNGIKKDICYTSKGYYTASFSYKFTHDDDTVYFSYCYPYTYSDLNQDIQEIESDPERRVICSRKTLCKSLAGVDCEILTVTEKADFEVMKKKRAVIISSRVHPGETVGSWMMRGVLYFITDPHNEEAKILRDKYVFKIIPMLNPDGVINGNYRCSLAGCDLNRRWKVPHRQLHPTIWNTKKLLRDIHNERGVLLYCDLHGHSRKQNVFMYGCNNKVKPEECRVFPLILSKLSPFFHFGSCRFGVQKSKDSTARVSVYKELKTCPNIFTMESTFSGIDYGEQKGQHLTQQNLQDMGRDLCRTVLIYENLYVPEELRHLYGNRNEGEKVDLSAMLANDLASNQKLLKCGDGDSSGGSDSEPSEDNLPVEEVAKVVPIVDKKQQMQLQKIQKKKQLEEIQIQKQPTKKMEESPDRSPQPRQKSPEKKKPAQDPPAKDDKDKKKKPEMKDACTQTERSDYQRIKKQQQQAKIVQEMKEQQARLRAQANIQFKSGQMIEGGHMRKTPQSQTGQRDANGNFIGGYQNQMHHQRPEKHLQDMRNGNKFQLSQDKYSLYQVQNKVNHQPSKSMHNQGGPGHNNLHVNMNMVLNQHNNNNIQQVKPGLIFQNNQGQPNSKNIIQMSQINTVNSGLGNKINNNTIGRHFHHGSTAAQQQQIIMNGIQSAHSQKQTVQGGAQNQPGNMSMPSFNKGKGSVHNATEDSIEYGDKGPMQSGNTSNQNNLRGAGSTISKAGELIMQQSSNFQSPKKQSNIQMNQQQLSNSGKNDSQSGLLQQSTTSNSKQMAKSDLRFQIQSITSQHFGGISNVAGNMGLGVKDQNILQNQLKNGLANSNLAAIGNNTVFAGQQQLLPGSPKKTNLTSAPVTVSDNRQIQPRMSGGMGPNVAKTEGTPSSQVQYNQQQNAYKRQSNPNGFSETQEYPQGKMQMFQNEALSGNPGIKRRSSQDEIRQNNQSQIQNNSRNHQEMENIKLFKSPNNSRQVIKLGGTNTQVNPQKVFQMQQQNQLIHQQNLNHQQQQSLQNQQHLNQMSTMNSIQYNQTQALQQQSFDKRSRKNSDGIQLQPNDASQIIDSNSIMHKNKQNPQHRKTLTFSSVGNAQYSGGPNHGQLTGQQQNVIFSSVIMNSKNQISPLKLSSNPDTPKTLGDGGSSSTHPNQILNQQQMIQNGGFKFNSNNGQMGVSGNSVNQRNMNNLQISQGGTHRSNPNVSNVNNNRIHNNQLNQDRLHQNNAGGAQNQNLRNSNIVHKSQMSKHIDDNRIRNDKH